MKTKSFKTKVAAFSAFVVSAGAALAVPPDLSGIGTEGLTGIAAGVTAGIPIAGGILAITVAIMVFRKMRNAGS